LKKLGRSKSRPIIDWKDVISSIEDIIEDARNGRMFVWWIRRTARTKKTSGDPAQMATPDAINFTGHPWSRIDLFNAAC
jgi:hypothetical protein